MLLLIGACANPNKVMQNEKQVLKKLNTDKPTKHKFNKNKKDKINNNKKNKQETLSDEDFMSIAKQKIQQAFDLKILKNKKVSQEDIEKLSRKIFAKQKNKNIDKHLQNIHIQSIDSIKVNSLEQISFTEIGKGEIVVKYKVNYSSFIKGKLDTKKSEIFELFFKIEDLYLDGEVLKSLAGKILLP